jgi:ATP-dependent protease ClpP protease subunit
MGKIKKGVDNSNDRMKMIDYERSVFVQGVLDDTLFSNLTPRIIALRKKSEKPITVFIDSPGGSLGAEEAIRGLLHTPDQMGRTCWVNTVVTGRAFSAAAVLLTSGDYIIAYPIGGSCLVSRSGGASEGQEILHSLDRWLPIRCPTLWRVPRNKHPESGSHVHSPFDRDG